MWDRSPECYWEGEIWGKAGSCLSPNHSSPSSLSWQWVWGPCSGGDRGQGGVRDAGKPVSVQRVWFSTPRSVPVGESPSHRCEGCAQRTPRCSFPLLWWVPCSLPYDVPGFLGTGQLSVVPTVLTVLSVAKSPPSGQGINETEPGTRGILTWAWAPLWSGSWKMRLKVAICFPMLRGK